MPTSADLSIRIPNISIVEPIDEPDLLPQVLNRHASGNLHAVRVVSNALRYQALTQAVFRGPLYRLFI
jgi:hypothetical protein